MVGKRTRRLHVRIVVGAVAAALGLLNATAVHAIGQQTAVTQVPGQAQGPESCPEEVNSNGSGIISMYHCTVTVSTNAAPGPVVAGSAWSAGVVIANVTFPTSPSFVPCSATPGPTGVVSFQYQDAYGSFAINAPMEYYVVGVKCITDYAASYPSTPVKLSSATGIYSLMDELCGFSLVGADTAPLTIGEIGSVDFRIDNSAKGACTPSNS